MPKTPQQALDELYAKAGHTPAPKAQPAPKPTMLDNYATLGAKMKVSMGRAMSNEPTKPATGDRKR